MYSTPLWVVSKASRVKTKSGQIVGIQHGNFINKPERRATSHTRLRAHDHHTSSTLSGGKGGAGPSSLHTRLEGPMEYVKARWM